MTDVAEWHFSHRFNILKMFAGGIKMIDEVDKKVLRIKRADRAALFPGLITDPVAAISADSRFVAGPATSALSALSFVAYRHGILTERHFHFVPEGSLFEIGRASCRERV